MKIEDFRNTTLVVDLLANVDFWPLDHKNNSLLGYEKLYHVSFNIFDFAINKHTERGENITSFTFSSGGNK